MGRRVNRLIRISVSDDMRIRELAEMMGISQSAVIRILLRNSITQICDETISKASAQQDAT
jgi:DNA-directed RNA polymerase specialized sigma subunit